MPRDTPAVSPRSTAFAAALLALALAAPAPASAHAGFACDTAYQVLVGSGDEHDDVPEVEEDTSVATVNTVVELDDVPDNLRSFRLTAYTLRGLLQEEALQVEAWTDWEPGEDHMRIYVEAGAPLVRIIIDQCVFACDEHDTECDIEG